MEENKNQTSSPKFNWKKYIDKKYWKAYVAVFLGLAVVTTLVVCLAIAGGNEQPEETTPEGTTPEATTPEVTTPEETTPEATTPEQTTPEETLPDPVPLEPACEHVFTSRIVLEQVTTKTDGKIANVCGTCGGWQEEILPAVKSLKILAIGNSFSDDALHYLPLLAKELGIEEIVIGNLYIGGCSVDGHWIRAVNGKGQYAYRKNLADGQGWVTTEGTPLLTGLQDEDWDIITMQQASGSSGLPETLNNLQNLINYVNSNKTNPNAKLYWHMTWAYSQFSTHTDFPKYDSNQTIMLNAILSTVQTTIIPNQSFSGIIPAGIAVQNYRGNDAGKFAVESSYITRDGYHLQTYARVVVSMTWLRTLTGLSLDDITCTSHQDITFARSSLKALKRAAEYAYLNPYEVRSAY